MKTEKQLSRLYSRKQRFPMDRRTNRRTTIQIIAFYFAIMIFYSTLLLIFGKLT